MTAPLDADAVRTALAGRIARLDVVERTGSTNADLLAAARDGAGDRTVLVAEQQDRGRGRLDRSWVSPPGAGLTFSVLLRPSGVPPLMLGWLPLLTGLAVAGAIGELCPVPVALKWPNDVLLGPAQAKGAGILAEADPNAGGGPAIVLGVGMNVATDPAVLPEGATSLHAEGATLGRAEVLAAVLTRLLADEADWRAAAGDPDVTGLRARYRAACATLGREVRVSLPNGATVEARARDVDRDGRLVLEGPDGSPAAVAAGDVVHLRALPS
jgi:BirA family transcriptional regulator, biotin operon repressor / biotin---[acetyl-CoA-carboxylase] ligase